MSLKKSLQIAVAGLVAVAMFGCAPQTRSEEFGDVSGVEEIAEPLTALATAPSFATGTLTVVMAVGETAIISKHAVNGNILVNDVFAAGATSTAVKNISITGSTGAEVVIMDFANGTFAPGTASAAGIAADMGSGADAFKIRGLSTGVDTVTFGGSALATEIAFNIDNNKDITVAGSGTIAYTVSLGGGNDVFNATSGAYGTGGAAFTGAVTVYGGLGDDTLTGGAGNDVLYGDLGNDTLSGGNVATDGDTYHGGDGTDTVTYAARTAAVTITVGAGGNDGESGETDDVKVDVEIVRGGTGNDTFTGFTGPQTFYGGAGDDTFLMGLLASTGDGNDTVYGEAGTDTVSYAARLEGVTVTMDGNAANDGSTGNETDNVRDDIENFICPTAAVVCTVTGNAMNNIITGGAGDDVLNGGAGDDTFVMGATAGIGGGADVITGGLGVDKVSFAGFGAVIDVTMDGVASTTMGKKIGTDVEDLTCPTASACTVTGNAGANRIVGSSGIDTINSLGGDDFIETSGAADVIDCGDGSDIVYAVSGTPTLTACEL